ncbi:hypothetical protein BU16DRAFT_530733, partial [Lophium mytilinum]
MGKKNRKGRKSGQQPAPPAAPANNPNTNSNNPSKKRKRNPPNPNTTNDISNATKDTSHPPTDPGPPAKRPRHPSSVPAPLDPSTHLNPIDLLPPQIRNTLEARFAISHIHVSTNTKLSPKVRAVVDLLHPERKSAGKGLRKPVLVALTAASEAANKELSIADIAVGELQGMGVRVWRYAGLSSRVEVVREKGPAQGAEGVKEEEEGEDEAGFEEMRSENPLERQRVRAKPVLTVWLATCEIKDLEAGWRVKSVLGKED